MLGEDFLSSVPREALQKWQVYASQKLVLQNGPLHGFTINLQVILYPYEVLLISFSLHKIDFYHQKYENDPFVVPYFRNITLFLETGTR